MWCDWKICWSANVRRGIGNVANIDKPMARRFKNDHSINSTHSYAISASKNRISWIKIKNSIKRTIGLGFPEFEFQNDLVSHANMRVAFKFNCKCLYVAHILLSFVLFFLSRSLRSNGMFVALHLNRHMLTTVLTFLVQYFHLFESYALFAKKNVFIVVMLCSVSWQMTDENVRRQNANNHFNCTEINSGTHTNSKCDRPVEQIKHSDALE